MERDNFDTELLIDEVEKRTALDNSAVRSQVDRALWTVGALTLSPTQRQHIAASGHGLKDKLVYVNRGVQSVFCYSEIF